MADAHEDHEENTGMDWCGEGLRFASYPLRAFTTRPLRQDSGMALVADAFSFLGSLCVRREERALEHFLEWRGQGGCCYFDPASSQRRVAGRKLAKPLQTSPF